MTYSVTQANNSQQSLAINSLSWMRWFELWIILQEEKKEDVESDVYYHVQFEFGFYDDVCVELFELSKWGLGWVAEW